MTPGGGSGRHALEETWARLAEEVEGAWVPGLGAWPRVQKRVDDWILTLEHVRLETGFSTRLRAPYRPSEGFAFAARDRGALDGFLETVGFLQDIEIGDPALDGRFVFKGSSWRRIRELFDDPRVREVLRAQPRLDLRAARYAGYGPPFPKGLWELQWTESASVTGLTRLRGLFELFELLLPRLCPRSRGYEGDVERLVERLLAPGGTVADPMGRVTLWDGNIPRRDAAGRLGRLGDARALVPLTEVLEDPDDELVARAVGALGELGDARAVGPLVRVLGLRRREAGGRSLSERAGEALERLGRGDLPGAFRRAMAGDPSSLPEVEHRDELVAALQEVLDSTEFGAAARAARALGVLGAREAIPLLRSKSRGWGMRTAVTEACREALEEIDARAGLPRPAGPPDPGDQTLPRPVDGGDARGDTLPRPVDGKEDG